jgi:hypothetical protein
MTSQTALAVVGDLLIGRRLFVRIVTRYAAEFIRAARFFKTTTRVHLLDRAHKLILFLLIGRPDKISNEQLQREARPKVKVIAATAQNPLLALEMTLLADRFAQGLFEVPRINNRMINSGYLFARAASLHMQLARSMTSLTPDCITLKNLRCIVIVRLAIVLRAVGVAEKTAVRDRPAEMSIAGVIAGRQVPFAFERIPGDGRLEKKAVLIQEIRSATLARSHGELHFGLLLPKLSTGRIRSRFLMQDSLSRSLDFIT